MHEPVRPRWETQQAFAGLLLDRLGPGSELVVAKRIDLHLLRQIGQRIFIGYHNVARLHPGDVELARGAQLAER
jgi:hypothetical protein